MRSKISAMIVAAGLLGFAATAQAAPVAAAKDLGVSTSAPIVQVQMRRMERRMMRHDRRVHRRVMRHRMMRHHRRMMHRM